MRFPDLRTFPRRSQAALEKYQPDASRPTNAPSRYPMRNHFIADYIFETTGKRRTPKQVGSRLQQLRDTCKAKRSLFSQCPPVQDVDVPFVVRQLISRRRRRRSVPDIGSLVSPPAATENSPGTLTSPVDGIRSPDQHPIYQQIVVWVAILLETLSWPSSIPIIRIEHNTKLSPLYIRLSSLPVASYEDIPTPPDTIHTVTSRLSVVDPTVAFAVPYSLDPHSSFSVFLDGAGVPIHTEVVAMQCHPCPIQNSGWLYSAKLVPGFWNTLRDSRCELVVIMLAFRTLTPIMCGI